MAFETNWISGISVSVLKEPIFTDGRFHKGAILINYVNELVRMFPELTSLFFLIERRGWHGVNNGEAADIKLVDDSSTLEETRRRFPHAILLDMGPPDFVDLECFCPLETPPDYDVIQISCWSRRKRIELFIETAAMLPDLSFVHLEHFEDEGSAEELEYREYCLKYAKKLRANIAFPFATVNHNDDFPGNKEDINLWINRAKIGVLTTTSEGINRFKMECLAANRPMLLCNDVGVATRKHLNERTGLLVPPNAAGVAEGISLMLQNQVHFAPRQYVLETTGKKRSLALLKAALADVCRKTGSSYHFDAIEWDGRNQSMTWGNKAIELLTNITRKYVPFVNATRSAMEIDQNVVEAAAQRYLMLANRVRADAAKEVRVNFFRGPIYPYPAKPDLLQLKNATVLAGEWFVTAGAAAHCDGFVQTPFPYILRYSVYSVNFDLEHGEIILVAEPPVDLPIQRGFLLGGCPNYCHWLLDYLPRLELYRSDCGPLLMNSPLQPFQIQALTYLGVNLSEVMPLDYPRSYRIRELFHPRTASHVCGPVLPFRPTIIDWLRDKFKRLRAASDGQRKLFISRGESLDTHARRLLNEDEVAGLASKQGFEIVRCEKLSFEAQVTLFSEARIIVGAHGAGLTNLIFAPRTAKIVELMGPRLNDPPQSRAAFVSPMFMKLASIVGQTYVRVVGKSDSGQVHMDFLPFETYSIEPAEFLAAIQG